MWIIHGAIEIVATLALLAGMFLFVLFGTACVLNIIMWIAGAGDGFDLPDCDDSEF